jgi:hypothetical protein
MKKIDLKKELKHLYAPLAKRVEIVDVPRFQFVMIDGQTEPGEAPETSPAFQDAMQVLYGLSFTLKFKSKQREANPIDYTVMALEGLWWIDSGEFDFEKKDQWKWTMMIMQPDHITRRMYEEALEKLSEKKNNPALDRARLESFHEGLCMQTMHVGPYSQEPETIRRMNAFAAENGYEPCGKHHEIYLGDPRRCKPERLRTILRRPITKRG